ncbi:MAG: hypothetical protein MUE54_01060 [Anaerolineae bacterium]|nr:hypothetical protein [Anaerolineae bacterium]
MMNILIGIIIGGIILFFWGGISQALIPWGIKSVGGHPNPDELGVVISKATTNGMIHIANHVAAFIAVSPKNYTMSRYFMIEFITQVVVSAVLVIILTLTDSLSNEIRLALVGLVGLITISSVDLQYWNWWGFSTRYTVGVAVNRLAGYLVVGVVLISWIL